MLTLIHKYSLIHKEYGVSVPVSEGEWIAWTRQGGLVAIAAYPGLLDRLHRQTRYQGFDWIDWDPSHELSKNT